ncbi:hypothetical protein I600_235 [Maribacter dokdonensis DSW-8]|nr:hypothetical protein I600_235 [Maribacter dokdonensis DSW-8]
MVVGWQVYYFIARSFSRRGNLLIVCYGLSIKYYCQFEWLFS